MPLENAQRSGTFDAPCVPAVSDVAGGTRDDLQAPYIPRFTRAGSGHRTRWPTVSVVVPTLNEARNLPVVLAELPGGLHEIVIVDGHSTDGTVEVARRCSPDAKSFFDRAGGKGDALRCGFEASTGDILVMLDADGSADPAEIPSFVAALVDGADFAKGTRFPAGGGSSDITPLRRNGIMGSANSEPALRHAYTDLCYGYNAFWRHCLPSSMSTAPGSRSRR